MELTCKSNENFLADDIRPLSDNELDAVNGGGAMLLGAGILLAVLALGLVSSHCRGDED